MTDQIQTNQPAVIGQLFAKKERQSFVNAIHQAILAFYANPNLKGLDPTECRVHPDHHPLLPETVGELPIVADATIRPNHLLICCPEPE